MLTDIFARRYASHPIWSHYTEDVPRLLVQCMGVAKDVLPYFDAKGQVLDAQKTKWQLIHDRLARELGVIELWPRYFRTTTTNVQGVEIPYTYTNEWVSMCDMYVTRSTVPSAPGSVDRFMKERLSLVELVMRERHNEINDMNLKLEADASKGKPEPRAPDRGSSTQALLRSWSMNANRAFTASVEELNVRFQQAGVPLSYHNGFIQVAKDEQVEARLAKPFWDAIADPKWQNTATDMNEAFDRRDRGAGDAAWYACRALESAIKIISDTKGWTTGKEKGAHNYIDNLVAERAGVRFIDTFEMEVLKAYFTQVRNQFGHGPGSQPMPNFSPEQTDWAIEAAMSWVRALVRRA